MHPNWNYTRDMTSSYFIHGDIAIIHLHDPVIETDTVKIIPIFEETPQSGSRATLTGWGVTQRLETPTAKDLPDLLQSIELTIIDENQCNDKFIPKDLRHKISLPRLFFCATNPKAIACFVSIMFVFFKIYWNLLILLK